MSEIIRKLRKSCLVVGIAGPGTGKTHLFREIIESPEYKGKKILILSFINKLISDLKEDFTNYENVEIKTLHGFARKILGENIEIVENLDNIITEDYYYLENKEFNFEEELYLNNFSSSKTIEEYEFYKNRKNFYKKGGKIYSFNTSIFTINLLFENEEKIPTYDLVLIDEFQDFNELEYELIKNLNKKNKIIIVGDNNQSLYDFKKADPSIITKLYQDSKNETFSLDYCWRCSEVIVDAANSLIAKSVTEGIFIDAIPKKFLYPKGKQEQKDILSRNFPKIDFLSDLKGEKLMYTLDKLIKKDYEASNNLREGENKDKIRILIIAEKHFHSMLYDGLSEKGFNIVDYELFSDEKKNNLKNENLAEIFNILVKRKTDNLRIREILPFYFTGDEIKEILSKKRKIWNCITKEKRGEIEEDIRIFKNAKAGKKLNSRDISRLNGIFNMRKVISKMIQGFAKIQRDAINIEIVNPMTSKGLSAELVYYLYVDDKYLFKKIEDIKYNEICKILVAITRAKEKLTIISKERNEPFVLELLGKENINIINV